MPSPSESTSYGLRFPSPSVSKGIIPPLDELGTPFPFTEPSILPSPSVSIPFDSLASVMPSLSESKSKLLIIPSPSVSQLTILGKQAAFSTISIIPSLSSSKSTASGIPSLSESIPEQPCNAALPIVNGQSSSKSRTPSPSESTSR